MQLKIKLSFLDIFNEKMIGNNIIYSSLLDYSIEINLLMRT